MTPEIVNTLLVPAPLWMVLGFGLVPALIARIRQRPITPWCIYGIGCGLLAWPLVVLPTTHALLLRPGGKYSDGDRQRQRRFDALALVHESSVRSYPSRIGKFGGGPHSGSDCRRYAVQNLGPREALELVRDKANKKYAHAVAYHHRGVHLGYVPKHQRWIADALDDGLGLLAITETVKPGWIFRKRAKLVVTRIIVMSDTR
jgi:hypothetical protein